MLGVLTVLTVPSFVHYTDSLWSQNWPSFVHCTDSVCWVCWQCWQCHPLCIAQILYAGCADNAQRMATFAKRACILLKLRSHRHRSSMRVCTLGCSKHQLVNLNSSVQSGDIYSAGGKVLTSAAHLKPGCSEWGSQLASTICPCLQFIRPESDTFTNNDDFNSLDPGCRSVPLWLAPAKGVLEHASNELDHASLMSLISWSLIKLCIVQLILSTPFGSA